MTSKDEQVRATIAEQASEWFVANDEAPLGTDQSTALVGWLKVSPVHVEEFLGVAAIARDLRNAGASPESALEALVARARAGEEDSAGAAWFRRLTGIRHWQLAAVAVAAVSVAIVGSQLWNLKRSAPLPAAAEALALHFQTGHGEQHSYGLPDNSVLHLNTDSAVTVQYSQGQRLVALNSGEAAFEVTHDAQRSFRVLAGRAEITDLGTKFNVRLTRDATVVTVAEGQIAVEPAMPGKAGEQGAPQSRSRNAVLLGANQQVRVSAGAWPPIPVAVDAQQATAWLHRQISFDHEPLQRVVEEFNRYSSKPIEITSPALRELQVSGVFSTDDADEFLAFLQSLEGVRVEITATQIRVSQK